MPLSSSKPPNALLHGALDALILKTLARGPSHGYAIARFIEETTGDAVLIEDGSLYPALYRLERKGLGRGRMGHVRARPARQAVPHHRCRPRAAGRRHGDVEEVRRRRVEGAVRVMKRSLRSWLWRVPLEQEIDEEIALHLELRTRELIERGMDPGSARELALERMGDVAASNETCVNLGRKRDREMRISQWLEELRDDVKFAFRQLRAAPVFTAIAVTTLALGIGANSAIFALVDATLLRPLPYANPYRLVTIWETTDANPRSFASPPNMLDWNGRSRTFEKIAGFTPSVGGMVMAGARRQRRNGVAPMGDGRHLRRARRQADRRPHVPARRRSRSAASVVVMSESLWESRFNRDPGIVGQRDQAGRHAVHGRRRRAEELRDPRPHAASGRCGRSSTCRRARAAHTCCRWSAG